MTAGSVGRPREHGIAEEQAALRRMAVLVARAVPPEEVFAAVAAEAGRLLAASHATMSRYDPDGAVGVVAAWSSTGAAIPVGTRMSLKDRVEALGGRISLQSPAGAGTIMQIALPLDDPSKLGWPTAEHYRADSGSA